MEWAKSALISIVEVSSRTVIAGAAMMSAATRPRTGVATHPLPPDKRDDAHDVRRICAPIRLRKSFSEITRPAALVEYRHTGNSLLSHELHLQERGVHSGMMNNPGHDRRRLDRASDALESMTECVAVDLLQIRGVMSR